MGFSPLEEMEGLWIPKRAHAMLGEPSAFRRAGEELLGCGLWPGDILIVDEADRQPEPGALVVVRGSEDDPEPREIPDDWADFSPALPAQIRAVRSVPIVGQYVPVKDTWNPVKHKRYDDNVDHCAVLPGRPAPMRIMGYAFEDSLLGVVHGVYFVGQRDRDLMSKYDWSDWDLSAEMREVRGRMRAMAALAWNHHG